MKAKCRIFYQRAGQEKLFASREGISVPIGIFSGRNIRLTIGGVTTVASLKKTDFTDWNMDSNTPDCVDIVSGLHAMGANEEDIKQGHEAMLKKLKADGWEIHPEVLE